jgi:HEAT repeat protein
LPALKAYLLDTDSAVRYWAVVGIRALGPEAGPIAPALQAGLADPSPNVRFEAAGTLCDLGECSEALLVLAKGLQDPREIVVLHAARTLQSIGDKAESLMRLMEVTRSRCRKLDGSYKNMDHAMFIDWALQGAIANCKS